MEKGITYWPLGLIRLGIKGETLYIGSKRSGNLRTDQGEQPKPRTIARSRIRKRLRRPKEKKEGEGYLIREKKTNWEGRRELRCLSRCTWVRRGAQIEGRKKRG